MLEATPFTVVTGESMLAWLVPTQVDVKTTLTGVVYDVLAFDVSTMFTVAVSVPPAESVVTPPRLITFGAKAPPVPLPMSIDVVTTEPARIWKLTEDCTVTPAITTVAIAVPAPATPPSSKFTLPTPLALLSAVPDTGSRVPRVLVKVMTSDASGVPLSITVACNMPGAVEDTEVVGKPVA